MNVNTITINQRSAFMPKLSSQASYEVRDKLLTVWGFDGLEWEPLEDKSNLETIFILDNYLKSNDIDSIIKKILEKANEKLYIISGDSKDFEINKSEFTFRLYNAICCDSTFDWVIYCSYHASTTFGGKWLIDYVRRLFDDRQELINDWGTP
jgi:hypothetical protein